jgi:hypothetical protein
MEPIPCQPHDTPQQPPANPRLDTPYGRYPYQTPQPPTQTTSTHIPIIPNTSLTPPAPPKHRPPTPFAHQAITALTLNTRGMHTTIIDLQSLLHAQPQPIIIALTETKHRHVKSIWRHTLKNNKLVFNPSLYKKKAPQPERFLQYIWRRTPLLNPSTHLQLRNPT